jgi:hypothetical protein
MRRVTIAAGLLAMVGLMSGCVHTRGVHATPGPAESGFQSLGNALRPFSRVGPAQTEQAIQRGAAMGRLSDLLR